MPKALVNKTVARIMSLQDPLKKMSKSDPNPKSRIELLDNPDTIRLKIKRAVTDSGKEIIYDREKKPAISNLLSIFSELSGKSIEKLEEEFRGKGYAEFKEALAEVIVSTLVPIQKKFKEYIKEKDFLRKVLDEGREYTLERAEKKVKKVKELLGLGR